MKKILGIYQNKHMHWVGDGFPVYNLFSHDRLGQMISPFYCQIMLHLTALSRLLLNKVHIRIAVLRQ